MTENEKQIKLQQLKAEVTEKRNEINRRKDDLHAQLNNELSIECDGMYNKKSEMLKVINETRTEKLKYAYGSERREEMEEQARSYERDLSLIRTEHEYNLHAIKQKYSKLNADLNDESRRVDAYFEKMKFVIMSAPTEKKNTDDQAQG